MSVSHADPVAPRLVARLIRAISTYSEAKGKVACTDPVMVKYFQGAGLVVDPSSPLAWASSSKEVEDFAHSGKLVACENQDWADLGAAIVVNHEGGRPIYWLYSTRVKATGLYVGSAVWKFARELR